MKYIKYFENMKLDQSPEDSISQIDQDIEYLVKQLSYPSIGYVKELTEYYKMTEEQIHNLRLALQYNYLNYNDYHNVVGEIINSKRDYPDKVWSSLDSERKLKDAYESNFKDKIIYLPEPYQIARHKNYKLEDIRSLDSFNLFDIIGKIPTKFGGKYFAGEGRYRNDKDDLTLWKRYQNTDRESEFIKVWNEKELIILTPDDIEYLISKENAIKFNI